MKKLKNLPSSLTTLPDEQLVWAIAVATIDMPSSDTCTASDIRFYERSVEARVRKLAQAESRYGWFSLRWTKPLMKRLVTQWFCGMLVIDPHLTSREGHPLSFFLIFLMIYLLFPFFYFLFSWFPPPSPPAEPHRFNILARPGEKLEKRLLFGTWQDGFALLRPARGIEL